MAKSKVERWLTKEGLTLLEGWARDGLTDEQIAKNCSVARSTLNEWKKKYPAISDTLKKNKEIADFEVENALFKRAKGYTITLIEQKLDKYGDVHSLKKDVHVPGDVGAMIYWLKNRQPNKWRDKQQGQNTTENEDDDRVILVDDLKDYENNKDK